VKARETGTAALKATVWTCRPRRITINPKPPSFGTLERGIPGIEKSVLIGDEPPPPGFITR
jgi:hypothetical protein